MFVIICHHPRRGWCWSYTLGGGHSLSQCGAGGSGREEGGGGVSAGQMHSRSINNNKIVS